MNAPLQSPLLTVDQLTPDQLAAINRLDGQVVQGRSCGSCSLCCKVVSIAEFNKPAGKWCQHCKPGNGCGIHAIRPVVCRSFYCEWMISKGLGPEWRPERSKFLLSKSGEFVHLMAHVDPGYPSAWRATPYYQNFKIWAAEAARKDPMHLVGIMIAEHLTVVLPDRDVDIGVVAPDELVKMNRDASGVICVEKVRRADNEPLQVAV